MSNPRTETRIARLMAAIISVVLILVTAVSYSCPYRVFAEEENAGAEAAAGETQEAAEGAAGDDGTAAGAEEAAGGETGEAGGEAAEAAAGDEASDAAAKAEEEAAKAAAEAAAAAAESKAAGEAAVAAGAAGQKPDVSASSYAVMSGSTSEVVATKHAERKMQPGAMTVLMTAMVVIDNMYNDAELSNTVDITEKLAGYGDLFKQGETISVGDLLNAMLVGGNAQAAEALARYSASKRKIFIKEMNSKCLALDIMDTQFSNPGGTYSTSQYSTAKDLAVIAQAALRYQRIRDTLSLKSVTITASSKEGSREIDIVSTNLLLSDSSGIYEYAGGGVSGNLTEPSNSVQFAASATKEDMQLIAILMDSAADRAAYDAAALLEYGYTKVTRNTIVKKDKKVGYVRVRGGASTRVPAYTGAQGFAYVPPEGSEDLIQTQVVMYDGLEAPLTAGDKVGEYRIFVADELKGTVDLIIKSDVPAGWPLSRFYISNTMTIVLGVILALFAAFIARVQYVKRRRTHRREAMRRAKIRELARRQMEIDEDRRRRNWNGQGYEKMPPRTSDIRKEAINEALRKERR